MLLRQLRSETESAIYLSADTLERGESLAGTIRDLRDGYRIRNFFVDKIHFADRFTAALKEIYDFYDVRVWFTSSSALALHDSSWDLSRRVIRFHLRAGGALRD